jgi:hypothetical protein
MEGPMSKKTNEPPKEGEPHGEHQDPDQAQWQTMM